MLGSGLLLSIDEVLCSRTYFNVKELLVSAGGEGRASWAHWDLTRPCCCRNFRARVQPQDDDRNCCLSPSHHSQLLNQLCYLLYQGERERERWHCIIIISNYQSKHFFLMQQSLESIRIFLLTFLRKTLKLFYLITFIWTVKIINNDKCFGLRFSTIEINIYIY